MGMGKDLMTNTSLEKMFQGQMKRRKERKLRMKTQEKEVRWRHMNKSRRGREGQGRTPCELYWKKKDERKRSTLYTRVQTYKCCFHEKRKDEKMQYKYGGKCTERGKQQRIKRLIKNNEYNTTK